LPCLFRELSLVLPLVTQFALLVGPLQGSLVAVLALFLQQLALQVEQLVHLQ
jgi:hypothetical protein